MMRNDTICQKRALILVTKWQKRVIYGPLSMKRGKTHEIGKKTLQGEYFALTLPAKWIDEPAMRHSG